MVNLKKLIKKIIVSLFRPNENFIINRFHNIYYNGRLGEKHIFSQTQWEQVQCLKCPLDMWVYQEIITEIKPDLIIETGTHFGGSALFMARLLDINNKGSIITIDIKDLHRKDHPRIQYITGYSTDKHLIKSIVSDYKRDNCLVILDSDHTKNHVSNEIELFSQYVSIGSYLIVEDTNINGHPADSNFGSGPYEAVADFLKKTDDFVLDRSREKFLMTFNPKGYLRRIK